MESARMGFRCLASSVVVWVLTSSIWLGHSWAKEPPKTTAEWVSFVISTTEGKKEIQTRPHQLLVCLASPPIEWALTRSKPSYIENWNYLLPRQHRQFRPKSAYRRTKPSLDQWVIIELNSEISLKNALKEIRKDASVLHVEPNYQVMLAQQRPDERIPNDFYFDRSWGLNNTGHFEGGKCFLQKLHNSKIIVRLQDDFGIAQS